MVDYTLIRSKRKTIALIVDDGMLVVRAPLKIPKYEIETFIKSKECWIIDKLEQSIKRIAMKNAFSLTYGDFILYSGQQCLIVGNTDNHINFKNECFCISPDLASTQVILACLQIYHLMANEYIPNRVKVFSKHMGIEPSSVKISNAKTRWGSCSSLKNISFSCQLMMAEDDVIDYVIVHELAHLLEMNHSHRFWAIVEQILPDYKERQIRLKKLQHKLISENWG